MLDLAPVIKVNYQKNNWASTSGGGIILLSKNSPEIQARSHNYWTPEELKIGWQTVPYKFLTLENETLM